jgi:hypothetical protein
MAFAQTTEPADPVDGLIWVDTDGAVVGQAVTRWSKAPTGGTTSLTGLDDSSVTLTYTAGYEQVYRNGTLLSRGNDYTATNGTSITLIDATLTGDIIEVIGSAVLAIADVYTQTQVNSGFIPQTTNFFAGKNKIINGDFGINQRNFSSTTTNGTYGFDRWVLISAGDGTNTYSAQTFTAGTAPVAGYEGRNFARIATTGQTQAGAYSIFAQRIESIATLAGQTATVSFWAKAASGTPKVAIELLQSSPGGTSVTNYIGQITLSTSWTRYSVTGNVSALNPGNSNYNAGNMLELFLWVSAGSTFNSRTGSIGIQTNTFDFWGVQVEAGSTATAFQTATGTIQGELAACQRYYWKWNSGTGLTASYLVAYAGSQANFTVQLPVTMRVAPSLDVVNGTNYYLFIKQTGGNVNMSTILQDSSSVSQASLYSTSGISGLTPGYAGQFYFNNASSYMAWSAEL